MLTVTVPSLAPKIGKVEITLLTEVTAKKDRYVNTAQIETYKLTPDGSPKDEIIPSEEVVATGTPEPTIAKTVDKEFARVGDVLHYTLTVTNPTPHKLFDAVVTDTLPTGVSLVESSMKSLTVYGQSFSITRRISPKNSERLP